MRRAQLEHRVASTEAERERDARDAEALRDRVRAMTTEEEQKRSDRAQELKQHQEFLISQVRFYVLWVRRLCLRWGWWGRVVGPFRGRARLYLLLMWCVFANGQMESRQKARAAKEQQAFLENKLMKREEERYLGRVQAVLETAAPETQFKRKKAQW